MAKTMTPSAASKAMTDGQITKAVAAYRALLEKHAPEFDSAVVQVVLGESGLAGEMFALFRKRVEVKAKEIVRRVKVDRTIEPQAMLDALGRTQYTDKKVVATMPKGEGEEVDFVFFKPEPEEYTRPEYMSDVDLAKALDRRGLTRDPYAQAQANKDDPAFADERPNGTHWKDGDVYNFATFNRWIDERHVFVYRSSGSWDDSWWFGGVRK
jgi:hypothetical protein